MPHEASRKRHPDIPVTSHYFTVLFPGRELGSDMLSFYELMTAPSGKILNQWFESEPLKATLVTDSLIGAMMGPNTPGSGYVDVCVVELRVISKLLRYRLTYINVIQVLIVSIGTDDKFS